MRQTPVMAFTQNLVNKYVQMKGLQFQQELSIRREERFNRQLGIAAAQKQFTPEQQLFYKLRIYNSIKEGGLDPYEKQQRIDKGLPLPDTSGLDSLREGLEKEILGLGGQLGWTGDDLFERQDTTAFQSRVEPGPVAPTEAPQKEPIGRRLARGFINTGQVAPPETGLTDSPKIFTDSPESVDAITGGVHRDTGDMPVTFKMAAPKKRESMIKSGVEAKEYYLRGHQGKAIIDEGGFMDIPDVTLNRYAPSQIRKYIDLASKGHKFRVNKDGLIEQME